MSIKPNLSGALGLAVGVLLLPSGPAAARQSASAQALLMEEIVVTARRREESLQDLPLSIAAISADAMQAQGIYSIEDVGEFVPNVTLYTSDRANNTRVVIRGIGGGFPDPVFVFGSGQYIDGHYVPFSLGGYMSTMDIERVEVLRGPQGTLFGKNVTGGAVNIISAKPRPEFDSKVTLRLADHGQQDFRGMLNVPFSDTVYGRFGVASESFDGYYYNRTLNDDVGGKDLTAFNAALRFALGDNWTIDTSVNIAKKRDDNMAGQCENIPGDTQQWGGGSGHMNRIYDGAKDDFYAVCETDAGMGLFVNSANKVTYSDVDEESAFFTAQWDSDGEVGALDNMSVKMAASYRYMSYTYLQDRDYSSWSTDAIGTIGSRGQDNRTRSAEILVEAQASDRLEFVLGVNYFAENAHNGEGTCRDEFLAAGLTDPANDSVVECSSTTGLLFEMLPAPRVNMGGPGPFLNTEGIRNESLGVFGHLTYALNDNWDFDFGARWTEDDREFWNMEWAIDGCTAVPEGPPGGPYTQYLDRGLCSFTPNMTYEAVMVDGFFNAASGSFDEITPMFSFTRNLAPGDRLDSGMVYFLYSEGFLTGGFNTELNSNLPNIGPWLTFDPEHVANYEVGFKGTLAGGRVRLMADIFVMDYTDKQDQITLDNPDFLFGPDQSVGIVQNVSEVDISGIEVELRATPWDGGFVSVDFGYLKNEYGSYKYTDPEDPNTVVDLTNSFIGSFTPDYTLNMAVEHEFQLAGGATLTPRLGVYMQDRYDHQAETRDSPPGFCNQPSYSKWNARLTYRPAAGNWEASLFGQNITDEKIYERCGDTRGVYVVRHERPAYWGVEFSARWGEGVR